MKLHAVFEIDDSQENYMRGVLGRLRGEINHAGVDIFVEKPEAVQPLVEPMGQKSPIEPVKNTRQRRTLNPRIP